MAVVTDQCRNLTAYPLSWLHKHVAIVAQVSAASHKYWLAHHLWCLRNRCFLVARFVTTSSMELLGLLPHKSRCIQPQQSETDLVVVGECSSHCECARFHHEAARRVRYFGNDLRLLGEVSELWLQVGERGCKLSGGAVPLLCVRKITCDLLSKRM